MKYVLLFMLVVSTPCGYSQTQPEFLNYTQPYDLEQLDFGLDVAHFYSKVDPQLMHVLEEAVTEASGPVVGKCYEQRGWCVNWTLATYGNLKFERMSMLVDTAGRLMAVCAFSGDVNREQVNELRKTLNRRFAPAVRSTGHFVTKYVIYTWDMQTQIIRMAVRKKPADEGLQTLDANGNIRPNDPEDMGKELVTELHFCIIRKPGGEQLVDRVNSGLFILGHSGKKSRGTLE